MGNNNSLSYFKDKINNTANDMNDRPILVTVEETSRVDCGDRQLGRDIRPVYKARIPEYRYRS